MPRCGGELSAGRWVLKKGREAPPQDPETAENERSHNRKFVRKLCSSERRPAASGRRPGTPPGNSDRAPHPALPVHEEDPDGRVCSDCGKASNGEMELVEVAAHVRKIRRKRLRPACACRTEMEAVGPAPARLFPNTRYGVWAYVLAERYGLHRPLRCRALSQHGLAIRHAGGRPAGFPAAAARRRDLPTSVGGAGRSRRRNRVTGVGRGRRRQLPRLGLDCPGVGCCSHPAVAQRGSRS